MYRLPAPIDGQWNRAEQQQAAEALKALHENGDDQAARELLSGILAKQFEQDLERCKQQIESLQSQIDALKAQVDKREQARERIIELRIELMINEADGLGFPSSWSQWPASPPTGMYTPAIDLGYYTDPATVDTRLRRAEQNSNRNNAAAPASVAPGSINTE